MSEERRPLSETIARLGELYRSDPELYELERKRLIEQTIDELPQESRQRAYGQQFRLEAKLSTAKDPVSRLNLMVELFWEQVRLFNHALNDPKDFLAEKERNRAQGKLIPLHPTKH